jgi:hypothetical protein
MIPESPSRVLAAVLISTALLVAGCKGDPPEEEKAAGPTRPMDVMNEVAKAKYNPPADGRLTEKQVEMYIAVKEREREIREAGVREMEAKVKAREAEEREAGLAESMESVGDVVGLTMADLRAALELGQNPKEYTWVKDRVAEAQVAEANRILGERVDQNRAEYLAMLEQERKAAATEQERAAIDRQVEEFQRKPGGDAAEASPAIRHNMALLAKYREELLDAQFRDVAKDEKTSEEQGR